MRATASSSTTTGTKRCSPTRPSTPVPARLRSTRCVNRGAAATVHASLKGIDVFGRGTFGGGGFNCRTALKAIQDKGLSTGAAPLASPRIALTAAQPSSRPAGSLRSTAPPASRSTRSRAPSHALLPPMRSRPDSGRHSRSSLSQSQSWGCRLPPTSAAATAAACASPDRLGTQGDMPGIDPTQVVSSGGWTHVGCMDPPLSHPVRQVGLAMQPFRAHVSAGRQPVLPEPGEPAVLRRHFRGAQRIRRVSRRQLPVHFRHPASRGHVWRRNACTLVIRAQCRRAVRRPPARHGLCAARAGAHSAVSSGAASHAAALCVIHVQDRGSGRGGAGAGYRCGSRAGAVPCAVYRTARALPPAANAQLDRAQSETSAESDSLSQKMFDKYGLRRSRLISAYVCASVVSSRQQDGRASTPITHRRLTASPGLPWLRRRPRCQSGLRS